MIGIDEPSEHDERVGALRPKRPQKRVKNDRLDNLETEPS